MPTSVMISLTSALVAACPSPATQARIDQLEDRAFQAMKSASDAVAGAARSGQVGAAGDAEWAQYKALRAEAEKARISASTECTASAVASVSVAAPTKAMTSSGSVSEAALPPPIQHFSIELSGGMRDIEAHGSPRVGMADLPVTLNQLFANPGLTQPISSRYLTPDGTFGPVKDGPREPVKSWGSDISLALSYSPEGEDRPGWRYNLAVSGGTTTLKSTSGYPDLGFVQTGAATVQTVLSGPYPIGGLNQYITQYNPQTPGKLPRYLVGLSPAVRQEFLLAAAGLTPIAGVNLDALVQESESYDLKAGVERLFIIDSPIGALNLSLGASLDAGWWFVKESEDLNIAMGSSEESAFDAGLTDLAYRRTINGPTFQVQSNFIVNGPLPFGLPLRWRVLGGVGEEGADIDAHLRSTAAISGQAVGENYSDATFVHNLTGYLGVGLSVNLPFDSRLAVDLVRQRELYLQSGLGAPGLTSKSSILFPDSTTIQLAPVYENNIIGHVVHTF